MDFYSAGAVARRSEGPIEILETRQRRGNGDMSKDPKRIAWVTGGGTGIGLAGAEALTASGWTVVTSGRRLDVLKDAAKSIAATGRELSVFRWM
jgi:short chain dehydrogenase